MSGDIVIDGHTCRKIDGEWHEVVMGVALRTLPLERLMLDEIERLRAEVADLTASGLALCDESDAFRANLAAERALADQLARALRVVRVTRHPTHVDNVWSVVSHAIAAYEEARRER